MRNLRLYNTDAAFKAHEQAAGGDGNATVTIVPGVSMSSDERKRYFNPGKEDIHICSASTIFLNQENNVRIGDLSAYTKFKYVSGITSEVIINQPCLGGFKSANSFKTINVPEDSSVTFEYIPVKYHTAKYNVTTTSSTTTLVYTGLSNYIDCIEIDDGTRLSSSQRSYTFKTTGIHEVKFVYSAKTSPSLPSNVFYNVPQLVSFEFGANIQNVPYSAFTYCTNLTSVTISDSSTYIGGGAFAYCTKLETITIPGSIRSIYSRAFFGCSKLKKIIAKGIKEPGIYSDIFQSLPRDGVLYYSRKSTYSTWLSGSAFYLGYYGWIGKEYNVL